MNTTFRLHALFIFGVNTLESGNGKSYASAIDSVFMAFSATALLGNGDAHFAILLTESRHVCGAWPAPSLPPASLRHLRRYPGATETQDERSHGLPKTTRLRSKHG
jgi:hypothetical protein